MDLLVTSLIPYFRGRFRISLNVEESRVDEAVLHGFLPSTHLVPRLTVPVRKLDIEPLFHSRLEVHHLNVQISLFPVHHDH